jgi:AcrR family transcriptional regulator
MPRPKRPTKDKLMDAAEQLFARRAFMALRCATSPAAAGVDLALVNYHFGSKKQLLAAVLERRGQVLNEERLQRLAAERLRAAPTRRAPRRWSMHSWTRYSSAWRTPGRAGTATFRCSRM